MNRFIIPSVLLALSACQSTDGEFDASGMFEATEVMVSSRLQGEIAELYVDEGDMVDEGDTLGRMDSRQLQLQRDQLMASRRASDARILSLEKQAAALECQIEGARREKERFSELLRDQAATRKQVDDLEDQVGILEAQLAALREQIGSQNLSLRQQSLALEHQIGQLEVQIGDAVLTAPIGGIILQRYCEKGEFTVPGKALFKVADIRDMRLRAYVTSDLLTLIRLGQKVTVLADVGKNGRRAYEGTVTWISQTAEFTPKTIQTRQERSNLVYAIKVSVDNADGLIKSGMYGDLQLH